MTKVPDDVVCVELVENSSVKNPHGDMVNSDVAALKHEKAVFHDSKAYVTLRVASISELIFIKVDLAVVFYRVVLSQHVHRNFLLGGWISP